MLYELYSARYYGCAYQPYTLEMRFTKSLVPDFLISPFVNAGRIVKVLNVGLASVFAATVILYSTCFI